MSAAPLTSAAGSLIRRLDPRLVNQIAAGEVIVRPASALKELIENSLDAGARRIEITVEDDARSFSIRDDGTGMSAEDARLAIERYATSKIETLEDLNHLVTRGFRGEALAAISSVCRFEMLTRRAVDDAGTHLRNEGGQNVRLEAAGLPPGTTIFVRDLFFNTPARMKFLRAAVQEWGYMMKEITRQSLTRPDVAFAVRWRGQPYLNLPGDQSLRDRLAALLPSGAGNDLLEVDHTLHEVRAWGCISSPKTTRRDRRHQFFFANGRPIAARTMVYALQEAYRGLIMTQQFPLAALFLEMPPEMIDVNVHPTKEEVRFLNEPLASGAIHRAAVEALRKADLVPQFQIATPGEKFRTQPLTGKSGGEERGEKKKEEPAPTPGFFTGEQRTETRESTESPETFQPYGIQKDAFAENKKAESFPAYGKAPDAYADAMAAEEATLLARLRRDGQSPRVLAQVAYTYIIAESMQSGLLLIDQHAVHEKLLYLKFQKRASRPQDQAIQELLIPHTYEASPGEREVLDQLAPLLTAEGFTTEHFGGGTFVVQSVPMLFEKLDLAAFLRDLIDEVGRGDLKRELDRVRHKIGARAACRAAIKAGDALTIPQMQGLVDQMLAQTEALRCPHGRPTVLLLSKEQLDRQFGRLG